VIYGAKTPQIEVSYTYRMYWALISLMSIPSTSFNFISLGL